MLFHLSSVSAMLLKRNIGAKIARCLETFPVVVLLGSRQSGKTTLARMLRPDWRYFDLEKASDFDFVTRDYDFFFRQYPGSSIINEAQNSPNLFRELRGVPAHGIPRVNSRIAQVIRIGGGFSVIVRPRVVDRIAPRETYARKPAPRRVLPLDIRGPPVPAAPIHAVVFDVDCPGLVHRALC